MKFSYLAFLTVQTRTSEFLRKDTELSEAFNIHFDRIGSIKKRLGYSRLGTDLSTTTSSSTSSSSISSSSSSSSSSSITTP